MKTINSIFIFFVNNRPIVLVTAFALFLLITATACNFSDCRLYPWAHGEC